MIYRTEDLDPQRCKAEYSQAAMEDLRWIGIDWVMARDGLVWIG